MLCRPPFCQAARTSPVDEGMVQDKDGIVRGALHLGHGAIHVDVQRVVQTALGHVRDGGAWIRKACWRRERRVINGNLAQEWEEEPCWGRIRGSVRQEVHLVIQLCLLKFRITQKSASMECTPPEISVENHSPRKLRIALLQCTGWGLLWKNVPEQLNQSKGCIYLTRPVTVTLFMATTSGATADSQGNRRMSPVVPPTSSQRHRHLGSHKIL